MPRNFAVERFPLRLLGEVIADVLIAACDTGESLLTFLCAESSPPRTSAHRVHLDQPFCLELVEDEPDRLIGDARKRAPHVSDLELAGAWIST